MKQGAKISRFKGIEIIQKLFSYYCGIILAININRYLKIAHIFSSAMKHLPRQIFDLAIESLNNLKHWKSTEWLQRRKWEEVREWRNFILFSLFKELPPRPPAWLLTIYLASTRVGGFPFLHNLSALIVCRLLHKGHSEWGEMVPHCNFDLDLRFHDVETFPCDF